MPRIEQHIIGTSVYIYDTVEHARDGFQSGGSGVLIGQPSGLSASWVHLYVVTNAHVRQPGGIVVRASTLSGEPKIYDQRYDDWMEHPASDQDLAVCWLGTVPTGDDRELNWVSRDSLVTEAHFGLVARAEWEEPWRYGPLVAGEDTFSVARFIGYDGKERNAPVVRFGNLASAGVVPVWQGKPRHQEQQSLLVEARSLAGASGAPVFVYRTELRLGGSFVPVQDPMLLGIGWGHIKHPNDVGAEYAVEMDAPGKPTAGRYNSGMMAVVPAWRIAELLDSDGVVAMRNTREREMEAREGETALDVATGHDEFQRFEDLTRKLVQVPKSELDEKRKRES